MHQTYIFIGRDKKKRFYLTEFLLNVGVDINMVYAVRHFAPANSSEPQTINQTGRTSAPGGVRDELHHSQMIRGSHELFTFEWQSCFY